MNVIERINLLKKMVKEAGNIVAWQETIYTALHNIHADWVVSGRFPMTRMPDMALGKVMVGKGAGVDPAEEDPPGAQIFEKSITSPANAGDVVVATITDQSCLIESIIIHADTIQTVDMTSCGVFGGAAKVITFIAAADALQADLNAIDKQVYWEGKVRLAAGKTIVISLVGTGVTPVDLTVTIKYRACVSGGYLA